MVVSIGKKIRYFRERAKFTQLELEVEIGASCGSICRIEADKVNPTTQTVLNITKVLGVSGRELSYLTGELIAKASDDEMTLARKEVNRHFSTPGVLAYLVDDRYRLIDISDTFVKFMGRKLTDKASVIGCTLIDLAIDPSFGVRQCLDLNAYPIIMTHLLRRFRLEMGFMLFEDEYQHIIDSINKDPLIRQLWAKVSDEELIGLQAIESRTVNFNIAGFKCEMIYANEALLKARRFDLVEYIPTNRVIRFLAKLW